MPSGVVEVSYVNMPRLGKKMGSIKDAAGTYYGIAPAMLGLVQQGGVYELFWEDREFQGKVYHTIKSIKPVSTPSATTATAAGKVLSGAQRAPTNPHDAERMWVCALLGHAIASGKIDPLAQSDVVEAGKIYREAQKLIFSDDPSSNPHASPQTQAHPETADELSDEIPF